MIALQHPTLPSTRIPAISPAIHAPAAQSPLADLATNPLGTRLLNLARAATAIHLAQTLRVNHASAAIISTNQA